MMSKQKAILTKVLALAIITVLLGVGVTSASPGRQDIQNERIQAIARQTISPEDTVLDKQLLAKASPDECYDGIGTSYPPGPPCDQGMPKVNEAYVWGLAKTGPELWFGTAANVHCAVLGASWV